MVQSWEWWEWWHDIALQSLATSAILVLSMQHQQLQRSIWGEGFTLPRWCHSLSCCWSRWCSVPANLETKSKHLFLKLRNNQASLGLNFSYPCWIYLNTRKVVIFTTDRPLQVIGCHLLEWKQQFTMAGSRLHLSPQSAPTKLHEWQENILQTMFWLLSPVLSDQMISGSPHSASPV